MLLNINSIMELLTQNSKLKKTSKEFGVRVFNFGIPAFSDPKRVNELVLLRGRVRKSVMLVKVHIYGVMLSQHSSPGITPQRKKTLWM